jgi:creatinine amidohydrolase
MSNFLFELTVPDIQERVKKCDVIVIPMGSCEKHGPHCPVGVDSTTTYTIATGGANKANVLYTPLIPYGYSPHHMGKANEGSGTITLSGVTYRNLIYDIARSLIYHGFNKLVFVSIHGSNTLVIEEVLRRIRYETGAFVCWYKPCCERNLELFKNILEGDVAETPGWHSGEEETSHALAYNESLVIMERAHPDTAHAPRWMTDKFSKIDGSRTVEFEGMDNIIVPMEHHEYCDTATIGNPLKASKEKGEKLFQIQSGHLASFLEEVKRMKIVVPYEKREWPERSWR